MFIVWGKKAVYRKLGHVADFCPFCREPKAFRLRRIGLAGHLYYISLTQGELVGYERTCHDCGTALDIEGGHYHAVSKQALPLPDLIHETFPWLNHTFGDRLALEEQIRRDPMALSPEQRQALIRQPFFLLSPKVEAHSAKGHIDSGLGLALAATLVAVLFGPPLVHALLPAVELAELLLGFLGIGLALVVWQIIASRPRYVRRTILPPLTRALRPLQPTRAELEAVVSEMNGLKHKMAKRIKVAEIQSLLAG